MENNQVKPDPALQSILTHIAEDAIAPEKINLWPAVQSHMRTQGEFKKRQITPLKTNVFDPKINRLVFVFAIVLLFVLFLLITPPGQVIANSIIKFFRINASNTQELTTPDANLVSITPNISASPTPNTPEDPAFKEQCGDYRNPLCLPQELKPLVTFDFHELGVIPDGIRFKGATGSPESVLMQYNLGGDQGLLLLYQTVWTGQLPPGDVGSGAIIETVQIGNVEGEYLKGGWIDFPTVRVWQSIPSLQTLRWVADGVFYQISILGGQGQSIQLDKEELVSLASSMKEVSNVSTLENSSSVMTVEQAEALIKRKVYQPEVLPAGYRLSGVTVQNGDVCLHYRYQEDAEIMALHIGERSTIEPISILVDRSLSPDAYINKQFVPIGGVEGNAGIYLWGSPQVDPVCNPDGNARSQTALLFKFDDVIFEMYGPPVEIITQLEMVRLAEQMTGIETTTGLVDPQRITSTEDAQAMVTFPLRVPGKLPVGWAFHHAVYEINEEIIRLYYYAGPSAESYGSFSLSQRPGERPDRLSSPINNVPDDAIEPITIGKTTGQIRFGCLITSTGSEPAWDKTCSSQTMTWQEGGIVYRIEAGFDARVAKALLIGVAESVEVLPEGAKLPNVSAKMLASIPIDPIVGTNEWSPGIDWVRLDVPSVGFPITHSQSGIWGCLVQSLLPPEFTGLSQQRISIEGVENNNVQVYSELPNNSYQCGNQTIPVNSVYVWQEHAVYYSLYAISGQIVEEEVILRQIIEGEALQ